MGPPNDENDVERRRVDHCFLSCNPRSRLAFAAEPGSTPSASQVWSANPTSTDCPGPVICVTSLNMRKWMKDRLQRRKKKDPEPGSQPAPPPLQPAYFDAEQFPGTMPEASHVESADLESSRFESSHHEAEISAAAEPEMEGQPAREDSTNASEPPRPQGARGESRGRGRRRRGGRGRGGRGREQAVAQAFSPAAAKGIVPDLPEEASEERTIRRCRTRSPRRAASASCSRGSACGRAASSQRHCRPRHWASRFRQKFLVQASQRGSTLQRHGPIASV